MRDVGSRQKTLLVALAATLVRCSLQHGARPGDSGPGLEAGDAREVSVDAEADVEPIKDGDLDAEASAVAESGVDAMSDAEAGVTMDAEAGVDAMPDAPPDSGIDARPDAIPEAGVDAMPDAPPDANVLYADCDAVRSSGRLSGVYTVMAGGAQWRTYCDILGNGEAWTLVAKIGNADDGWRYDSERWSDSTTINIDDVNLNDGSAKFLGFNTVQAFEARLSTPAGTAVPGFATLSMPRSGGPLLTIRQVFQSVTLVPTVPRAGGWSNLVSGSLVPGSCRQEGFNVTSAMGNASMQARIRVGIIGSYGTPCNSVSGWLGAGGAPTDILIGGGTIVSGNRTENNGLDLTTFRRLPQTLLLWVR